MRQFLHLIVLSVFFCTSTSLAEIGDKKHFTIGAILALTGPAADYGTSIRNSIELARKDKPELFQNVRFLYEDVEHDPKKAVTAFQKFVDVDHVDLIYTWGVTFCKALAPLAESRKIPLVAQCIDNKATVDKHFVIKFMNNTDEYLRLQTQYLKSLELNKIGVVIADHGYIDEMYEALERNLLPGQTVQIVDRYAINEMNLRSSVTKLRKQDFDVIGVFLYSGQIAQFYRQAREQHLNTPTFGTNFFESLSEVQAAQGTMDGSVFVHTVVNPEFIARFKTEYGNVTQLGFGALAYEFALLTGELFGARKEKLSAEEIIRSYSLVVKRPGVAAGPYTFKRDPLAGQHFSFPLSIKSIDGEKFDVVSKHNPMAVKK